MPANSTDESQRADHNSAGSPKHEATNTAAEADSATSPVISDEDPHATPAQTISYLRRQARYMSVRLTAIESGLHSARCVIPAGREPEAIARVVAAGGAELEIGNSADEIDIGEEFDALLRHRAGVVLLLPDREPQHLAVEIILFCRDREWLVQTTHAMPLLRGTEPVIWGPVSQQE